MAAHFALTRTASLDSSLQLFPPDTASHELPTPLWEGNHRRTESWNCSSWRRPLRSSSPTINLKCKATVTDSTCFSSDLLQLSNLSSGICYLATSTLGNNKPKAKLEASLSVRRHWLALQQPALSCPSPGLPTYTPWSSHLSSGDAFLNVWCRSAAWGQGMMALCKTRAHVA